MGCLGLGRGCADRFWALSGKGFELRRGGFGEVVLGFGGGTGWVCGVVWWAFWVGGLCQGMGGLI